MNVSFTIDLEDPTELYAAEGRYAVLTRQLLKMCDEYNCHATFFTVGKLAEASPQLIRNIAAKGHEIAYHSRAHVPLTEESPNRFRQETKEDKDRLEQLTGKSVIGYRAPRFSLTPQSLWAVGILHELGFVYSSSIMPTGASLYGFREAPHKAFRWPNGLIEFPLPVATFGSWRIPYLGGIYLYALPSLFTHYCLGKASSDEILWTYTHPYDFDRAQGFMKIENAPMWVSTALWLSRFFTEGKIRKLLSRDVLRPLGERALDFKAHEYSGLG